MSHELFIHFTCTMINITYSSLPRIVGFTECTNENGYKRNL